MGFRSAGVSVLTSVVAGSLLLSTPIYAGAEKKPPAHDAKQAAKNTGKEAGTLASNAATTATIKTALLADKVAPGMAINVDTNNGVVTLSGQVDSKQQKMRAEQIAKKTKGVHKVIDKLTVKSGATATKPAPKK